MTQIQIDYNRLREQQRAARVNETLTAARDSATRAHYERADSETARHNAAEEGVKRASLDETARHNLISEAESHRAAVAKEGLTQQQVDESVRAAKERERLTQAQLYESIRASKQKEALQEYATSSSNLLRSSELIETAKAHRAQEDELKRSHLASEAIAAGQLRLSQHIQPAQLSLKQQELASLDSYRQGQLGISQGQLDQAQKLLGPRMVNLSADTALKQAQSGQATTASGLNEARTASTMYDVSISKPVSAFTMGTQGIRNLAETISSFIPGSSASTAIPVGFGTSGELPF